MQGDSCYGIWRELYNRQLAWGDQQRLPPLLANFGVTLVERALIEAVCRARGQHFAQMLRTNQFGIPLGDLHEPLAGMTPANYLPESPSHAVTARHTVGLGDPLTEAEIPAGERLEDGLPQSLEACVRTYGLRHFKIKVSGDLEKDRARLGQLNRILTAEVKPDFAFSLDGNEFFQSAPAFQDYWRALTQTDSLQSFFSRLLFVEQPLHRSVALQPEVGAVFSRWNDRPLIIIDESDATLESLPAALALGYTGTSHKNCKGIIKGIAHRCLLAHLNRREPDQPRIMSGEDLCNIGPVALLQDLAVMAALGIESVERNGHHYHAGLSQFPISMQEQVLQAHGDLYHPSPAGWPTLAIHHGRIQLQSLNQTPFGPGFVVDLEQFSTPETWKPPVE
jgi:hypothetical protein